LALAVPLSRFTSRVGGGSAFFVSPHYIISIMNINPFDIAKDIVRIGSTAGLKKDVVDLLEAKLRILTDELALAHTKVSKLEIENGQLRARLKNPAPVIKLDDVSRKALQYFCDRNNEVTIQELDGRLSCPESKSQFFCDRLIEMEFIEFASIPIEDPRFENLGNNNWGYKITPKGRKYWFENEG
jgi:hypothetical protein